MRRYGVTFTERKRTARTLSARLDEFRLTCASIPTTDLSAVTRKEVFQPHLPVRLPCYDLAPITSIALGRALRLRTSGAPGFHGLTGGVYKARERIHHSPRHG